MEPRKLNVLLVVPWDQESGGVAAVAGYLAQHLVSDGHRVVFLHPGTTELARPKTTKWGFGGYELKLRAPFNPAFPLRSVISFCVMFPLTLLQLVALLRRERIDVVNIHYPGAHFVYFALCRWLTRSRLVISIHGMDAVPWDAPDARPARSVRLIFRASDLIVAPSWRFLRRCSERLAPFKARQIAIHNGTDLPAQCGDGLQPVAWRAEARHHTSPFLLSVCSLDEWKGLDVLIRAIAKLRDNGQRLCVIVAGEGPMRASLETLINELAVRDLVELRGQQSRQSVDQLLHDCTAFVLASRFESFGIAAVEAMAAGKAVVATRVDGILEIIDDGENGLLSEPGDIDTLALAIARVVDNPTLRDRLGRAARQRVAEHFQRRSMGEKYTQVFHELIAHRI